MTDECGAESPKKPLSVEDNPHFRAAAEFILEEALYGIERDRRFEQLIKDLCPKDPEPPRVKRGRAPQGAWKLLFRKK